MWQQILRLQDWDIELQLCRRHEMESVINYGECSADPLERTATIRVLWPDEVPPEEATDGFVEGVIVHELLHLYFSETHAMDERDSEEHVVRKATKAFMSIVEAGRG